MALAVHREPGRKLFTLRGGRPSSDIWRVLAQFRPRIPKDIPMDITTAMHRSRISGPRAPFWACFINSLSRGKIYPQNTTLGMPGLCSSHCSESMVRRTYTPAACMSGGEQEGQGMALPIKKRRHSTASTSVSKSQGPMNSGEHVVQTCVRLLRFPRPVETRGSGRARTINRRHYLIA